MRSTLGKHESRRYSTRCPIRFRQTEEQDASPQPRDRPDLQDGYDCQESNSNTVESMMKNMLEHVKKAIADRCTKAEAAR